MLFGVALALPAGCKLQWGTLGIKKGILGKGAGASLRQPPRPPPRPHANNFIDNYTLSIFIISKLTQLKCLSIMLMVRLCVNKQTVRKIALHIYYEHYEKKIF